MADVRISDLVVASQLKSDDYYEIAQAESGTRVSYRTTLLAIAVQIATAVQLTSDLTTDSKTLVGAINELKQKISLIPKFSIDVVQTLPTEDISDTTIYLVPSDDPETENAYDEYINLTGTTSGWEKIGSTDIDMSAYYTKLEVDGLLATKASVAEVALKENKSDMPTDVRTIIKDCKTPKNATITNGIAQFECIEENLVKGLKVTMNPIQDLHGYSNPWAGGAGKNKLDLANASLSKPSWYSLGWNAPTLTADGNGILQTRAYSDSGAGGFVIDALPSGDYTISVGVDDGQSGVFCGIYYTTDGSDYNLIKNHNASMTKIGTTERYYINFTVPSGATQLAFRPTINIHSTPYTIGEIQIESGNQATDFSPYSNICPISGRTEASVTRTGKNILCKTIEGVTIGTNGAISANSSYNIVIAQVLQGKTYTFSLNGVASVAVRSFFTAEPALGSSSYNGERYTTDNTFVSPITGYVAIRTSTNATNIQLENGSTATEYTPYVETETHTHQYSETIYGGVDDFVNGELINEWNSVLVDLGDFTWSYVSSGNRFTYSGLASVIKKPATDSTVADIISNQLKTLSLTALRSSADNALIAVGDTGTISVRYTGSGTDAEQFKTDIAGTKIMFKLATPTTISTSAEEITTVSGTNIISGTEPISECKYTELATVDDLIKIIGGQ